MATTKISKKQQVLSALGSFLEKSEEAIEIIVPGFVFLFIFCPFLLPTWWALDILFVLTSPIWYSLLIWWSPKKASEIVNVREKPDESNWFEKACSKKGLPFQNWCNTVWMKKIWMPVVNRLPMSYRDYFIFTGTKPFEEYPVQTQLEYWNYEHDDLVRSQLLTLDEKKSLKENGIIHRMSEEAIAELWKTDDDMRRLLLKTRCEISEDRLKLLLKEKPEWLKPHLLAHTPNNVVWGWLIEAAESTTELGSMLEAETSIVYAFKVVKELAEQDILKPEVLYKIFAKETAVSKAVAEIIDKKADKKATTTNQVSRFTASDEKADAELEKARHEAGEAEVTNWRNFCQVKDTIDIEAQKKMKPWQYFIFAERHPLSIPALQKFLYEFKYKGWVKTMMKNEWDNIEKPLVLPLIKADKDLYNIYLELKVEKK